MELEDLADETTLTSKMSADERIVLPSVETFASHMLHQDINSLGQNDASSVEIKHENAIDMDTSDVQVQAAAMMLGHAFDNSDAGRQSLSQSMQQEMPPSVPPLSERAPKVAKAGRGLPGSRRSTRKPPPLTQPVRHLTLTGWAYDQWRRIGAARGFSADTDIACFLMQHYQDCMSGFQSAATCAMCHTPLALTCPGCNNGTKVNSFVVNNAVFPDVQSTVSQDSPSQDTDDSRCHTAAVNDYDDDAGDDDDGNDDDDDDDASEDPDFMVKVKFSSSCTRGQRGRPPKSSAPIDKKPQFSHNTGPTLPPEPPPLTPTPPSKRQKTTRPETAAATGKAPKREKATKTEKATRTEKVMKAERVTAEKLETENALQTENALETDNALEADNAGRWTEKAVTLGRPRRTDKGRGTKRQMVKEHRLHKRRKGVVSVSEARKMTEKGENQDCEEEDDDDEALTKEGGKMINISQEGKTVEELMQPGPGQRRGRKPTKNVKSVECPQCGARFTRRDALKVHMRLHTGERPYQCDQCSETFSLRASWVVHKRKHNNERPYVCKECGLTFNLAATLNQHIKIHSGVRPFLCTVCSKSFHRSGDLTTHMRSHTGYKPYLCQDCGKSFPISSDLNKHRILVHTDSKPYECQWCHKRFPFSHRLKAHVRIHTGEKDFLCTICGSKFAHKNNLTTHFRQHTGEKPYQCEVEECGKRFADYGNLCKHRRSSHGGSGKKPKPNQVRDGGGDAGGEGGVLLSSPPPLQTKEPASAVLQSLNKRDLLSAESDLLVYSKFFSVPSSSPPPSSSLLPLAAAASSSSSSGGLVFTLPAPSGGVAFPTQCQGQASNDDAFPQPSSSYPDFSQPSQMSVRQLGSSSYL